MNLRPAIPVVLISAVLLCLPACAGTKNPHFFPRLQPLFAGLDESRISPKGRAALAQAKVDFQLVRHDKAPQYARYVRTIPYTNSRVYQGNGYCITMVHKNLGASRSDGPAIVVDASITGGEPFHYDHIDEAVD